MATLTVDEYLASIADAPARELERDDGGASGVRAWHVVSGGTPYFLKFAPHERYAETLAKDAQICAQQLHPAIVRLLDVVALADGTVLRFEHFDGEDLTPENRKRFFALPLPTKLEALSTLFGALAAIVRVGWILVDFYEGNVLYNFSTGELRTFDFEFFERADSDGGFTLRRERNPGSTRLMAPEEWVKGDCIDQTTNVYTLGRYAINALSSQIDERWRDTFEGSSALRDVIERATQVDRKERYQIVGEFLADFDRA